ncbi:hypothetical protein BRADI_5g13613v3 [Brachypodium distachyon]|uniref:Uncharacterized protein n=1 Tax=Brachypodium distachyon TaxID=15368 RepID=A0A0Q3P377_BRADI|nr:hypothetical protein BRADI_5g13613v3 [Brachypodium distachyon]
MNTTLARHTHGRHSRRRADVGGSARPPTGTSHLPTLFLPPLAALGLGLSSQTSSGTPPPRGATQRSGLPRPSRGPSPPPPQRARLRPRLDQLHRLSVQERRVRGGRGRPDPRPEGRRHARRAAAYRTSRRRRRPCLALIRSLRCGYARERRDAAGCSGSPGGAAVRGRGHGERRGPAGVDDGAERKASVDLGESPSSYWTGDGEGGVAEWRRGWRSGNE